MSVSSDLLRGLSASGRAGGAIALVIGLAGLGLIVALWPQTPLKSLDGVLVLGAGSLLFILGGLAILISGGTARWKPWDRAELLAELPRRQRPFAVCPRCQVFVSVHKSECSRCGDEALKVSNDVELAAAQKKLTL